MRRWLIPWVAPLRGGLPTLGALLLTLMLAGCSDPAPAVETPVIDPPEPAAPPVEPPPVESSPVEPPSVTDADLDAMDEPALEAACFAGSSAACDRLGH
jgi:hypothetical protein